MMSDWTAQAPRIVRLRLVGVALSAGLLLAICLQRGSAAPAGDGLSAVAEVATQALAGARLELRGAPLLVPLDAAGADNATRFAVLLEGVAGQGAPADLLRVTVERAPSGRPVRVGPVFNLTGTQSADERVALAEGRLVLSTISNGGAVIGLQVFDFGGEPGALTQKWSWLDRAKNRVSNWQETGQRSGLGQQRLMLEAPVASLTARRGPDGLSLVDGQGPAWRVVFSPGLEGEPQVEALRQGLAELNFVGQVKGQRPHLGWVVDTVRDISWVGPNKIARAEDVAFNALDWLKRARASVFGAPPVEAPVMAAQEVGAQQAVLAQMPMAQGDEAQWRPVVDRREGRVWPPKAGEPVFEEPGPGEGRWVPMTNLIKPAADRGVVFYQSWIRPDAARHFALVSVTAFDPSRLQIGMVAGTREPQSKTGQKGTGKIPRRAEVTPRLVAAFNGGFQSKHGSFGMVEESRVIAPPMGEAATVLSTQSGRVLMGVWPIGGPRPNKYMRAPGVPAPDWVTGMRQNLDPLVDRGMLNPSRRRKWGSTAGVTSSGVFTVRTGLCLLEGGAMAYFFGSSVSAEMLGQAMLAFHCGHGIHLDMNAGHSGFEFYNVKDVEGKDFEAARMIQKMWHMNFPRYIQRDARDYFYLRHRVLPMERLEAMTGVTWRPPALRDDAPHGLMSGGEPARVLVADVILGGGEAHIELVRLPRAGLSGGSFTVAQQLPTGAQTVLMGNVEPGEPDAYLDLSPGSFGALSSKPTDASVGVAVVLGEGSEPSRSWEGEGKVTVMALGERDVVVADCAASNLPELSEWFASKGFESVVAVASPADAGLAMRLVSKGGEEAFRGGPLRQDRPFWRLDLAPAPTFTDRVEGAVEATHSGQPSGGD